MKCPIIRTLLHQQDGKDFSKYSEYIDEQHNTIEGPDIDKINALIESGEFFTYEGVERIK